jgi:hypothetical protein
VDVGKKSNRIVTVYGIPSTEILISLFTLIRYESESNKSQKDVRPSGIMKPKRAETNPEVAEEL